MFTCDVDEAITKEDAGQLICTPGEEYDVPRRATIDFHDTIQLDRMEYLERGRLIVCDVEYRIPKDDASVVPAEAFLAFQDDWLPVRALARPSRSGQVS